MGGDDIYAGGIRDIAKLYEYWVFFLLLKAVGSLLKQGSPLPMEGLLKPVSGGVGLQLKSGKLFQTGGMPALVGSSTFRIQFSYNRNFPAAKTTIQAGNLNYETSYPNPGSWTRSMQPDYTISFWPGDLTPEAAEVEGKICHLHFDAKYRLEQLSEAFGNIEEDSENLTDSELDLTLANVGKKARKDYKRIDLLKMHAYKDSIRRSHGAYIIYPGLVGTNDPYRLWMAFHEVIPGLGAFCLRPDGTKDDSLKTLQSFLIDALNAHADPGSEVNSHKT